MWCPEGYITLEEISSQILWDSDIIKPSEDHPDREENSLDQIETKAFLNWMMAVFLHHFGEKVRVSLVSGSVATLHPSAFFWFGDVRLYKFNGYDKFPETYADRKAWSQVEFSFIDVGLGFLLDKLPHSKKSVQSLAGLPLCVKSSDLPVFIDQLPTYIFSLANNSTSGDRKGKRNRLKGELSNRICEAFEEGRFKTKSEAKRLLAPDMKFLEWHAHWREASARLPQLSTPGRRAT